MPSTTQVERHPQVNHQIRWKNFRGFRDTGWITLRPLTVLVGPNNSGKSSLMAPLLLLAQTVTARDPITPLVTRGSLIDVGYYRDFVSNHNKQLDVELGIRFHTHEPKGRLKSIGTYPPGAVRLTFAAGPTAHEIQLKHFEARDIYDRRYFARSGKSTGFSATGWPFSKMRAREVRAIRETRPLNFFFTPTRTLNRFRSSAAPDSRSFPKTFSDAFGLYLSVTSGIADEMLNYFGDVSYIGPLRERLHRFHEVSAERPRSVGARGENTGNLLRTRHAQLSPFLRKWAKAFEFGDSIKAEQISSEIFAIELSTSRTREVINIADAGFGVSQVLPLIVQAHAARTNSLTIAEQPEVHLNPRSQCVLADLFVEMVALRHRLVVETHSEHLILRLRRLIAQGEISPANVAIYFVEKCDEGSTIREITIDKDGHIAPDEWPVGFFEDNLKEALALATAQSRNAKKKAT